MNSAFRILANDEPINRNLVIVVNKNGQVATDTDALQNLLTSKGNANTGVSILRETSPTPSISEEIERERKDRIEMKRQEYLQEHADEEIDEEELENQMRRITGSMSDDVPHVSLTVEGFYPPDQARKFANDILHLGGVENPSTLLPIDFDFQRQIIKNDHCYTPLTQSPERSEKPQTSSKSSQKNSVKRESKPTAKLRQQQLADDESSDSGDGAEEEDDDYGEEQSEDEDEEISYSESDDDNDMDFSVNDRFGKKGKKKRKYRKHKQKVKEGTFKDFLETGEAPATALDEDSRKKFNKGSPTKKIRPSTSGKSVKLVQPKVTKTPAPKPPKEFVPIKTYLKIVRTVPASPVLVQSPQSTNIKQEIEFVESFVKDLEKTFPQSSSTIAIPTVPIVKNIPNIVQMMDTNTPAEVIDQSLSSFEQLDASTDAGMDEIGEELIAALGNEALDELLNHNDLLNFAPAVHPTATTSTPLATLPMALDATLPMTSQAPRILNKQAPVKDPIKVVRNGRVITLPPIEAPTTRGAKRRAQGDSPSTGKVAKTDKSDSDSRNSSRRSSLNKSESGKSSRRQSTVQADEVDEPASDNSQASEDDPNRLWCICQQPHNNRFMICCDKCEEWFHGKCVNVTKAMGKEIEANEREWTCPNCKNSGNTTRVVKKKPLNQQKLTKFFAKSQKESTDEDVAKTLCVMCNNKPARDSSIYCSDECIQKHAIKHADNEKDGKLTKPDSTKRGNVLKDKNGNVSHRRKVKLSAV